MATTNQSNWDAFGLIRIAPATATPMEGLYTCGASNYPGGLVLGGSGYIGANKVAEDLGVNKWWKPTPEMDKYIKTYLEGGPIGIGGLPTE